MTVAPLACIRSMIMIAIDNSRDQLQSRVANYNRRKVLPEFGVSGIIYEHNTVIAWLLIKL